MPSLSSSFLYKYSLLLAKYPVLVAVLVAAVVLLLSTFAYLQIPDDYIVLDDPIRGFEPRGTELINRWNTREKLRRPVALGIETIFWGSKALATAENDNTYKEIPWQGDCSEGSEVGIYEGSDNPGKSFVEKKIACGEACSVKKTHPFSGSWDGFVAKGFIVSDDGRCFCESSESRPSDGGDQCDPRSAGGYYQRYDLPFDSDENGKRSTRAEIFPQTFGKKISPEATKTTRRAESVDPKENICAESYVVQAGDSLSEIAANFAREFGCCVTWLTICRYNEIVADCDEWGDGDNIYAGDTYTIPNDCPEDLETPPTDFVDNGPDNNVANVFECPIRVKDGDEHISLLFGYFENGKQVKDPVYKTTRGERSILSKEGLQTMCSIDQVVRNFKRWIPHHIDVYSGYVEGRFEHWGDLCATNNNGTCCATRSMYINGFVNSGGSKEGGWDPFYKHYLLYDGDNACDEITDKMAETINDKIHTCASHYYSGDLRKCALASHGIDFFEPESDEYLASFGEILWCTQNVPEKCLQGDGIGILDAFLSLMPMGLGEKIRDDPHYPVTLARSMISTSSSSSRGNREFKEELMKELDKHYWGNMKQSGYTGVALLGYEMGIKGDLYKDAIMGDLRYAVGALVAVIFLMWYYTGSFLITLFAFLEILSSLGLAFFLNLKIMKVPLFPFMNAVTLYLAVGIGVDDVFVYIDSWRNSKDYVEKFNDSPLSNFSTEVTKKDSVATEVIVQRLVYSLRHAGASTFVTSFTTSAAFLANCLSSIVAVKCFGLYAATVIMCDYILMISFLPAIVILFDRPMCRFCRKGADDEKDTTPSDSLYEKLGEGSGDTFEVGSDNSRNEDGDKRGGDGETVVLVGRPSRAQSQSPGSLTPRSAMRNLFGPSPGPSPPNTPGQSTTQYAYPQTDPRRLGYFKRAENFVFSSLFPNMIMGPDNFFSANESKSINSTRDKKIVDKVLRHYKRLTPYLWLVCLSCYSLYSAAVATVLPGLDLPSSMGIQEFASDNPMEVWEMNYMEDFATASVTQIPFEMEWFFGVVSEDNGDKWNVFKNAAGRLNTYKITLTSSEAQKWMYDFQEDIKKQSWYKEWNGGYIQEWHRSVTGSCDAGDDAYVPGKAGSWGGYCRCPISGKTYAVGDNFDACASLSCLGGENVDSCSSGRVQGWEGSGWGVVCARNRTECCGESFPLSKELATGCLNSWRNEQMGVGIGSPGLYYDKKGDIAVTKIKITSTQNWSPSYHGTKKLWDEVESFSKAWMKKAPGNLKHGFVVMQVLFLDLQQSLAKGVSQSISVSFFITAIVLFLCTKSLALTILGCCTILMILATTAAALVKDGWVLNVGESVVFSVAVGLSVDFCVHYGWTVLLELENSEKIYYLSDDRRYLNRRLVIACLKHVGPSVTMGALTTMLAGTVMGLCKTLFFLRFGKFLVVVMTFSWIYTNFFFLAAIAVMPPRWLRFDLSKWVRTWGRDTGGSGGGYDFGEDPFGDVGGHLRGPTFKQRKLSDNDQEVRAVLALTEIEER